MLESANDDGCYHSGFCYYSPTQTKYTIWKMEVYFIWKVMHKTKSESRTTDAQWSFFFHPNTTKLLGLGRQFGQINFGAYGVLSVDLSAPILVQCSVVSPLNCPCFLLFRHYFYKKLGFYIHIPNIYLGLGFECGSQRIRDSAVVCP